MGEPSSSSTSSSSIFSQTNPRIPDDTVFYSIYPDTSLNPNTSSSLQSLHLQILQTISPHLTNYIWQHQPFTLSLSSTTPSCICTAPSSQVPHLHGKTRYGDNLEDEWFVVFFLFEISRRIPQLSIRVWDTDGEFLLIEAAFSLPRWINTENSENRVFIRNGDLCIVPRNRLPGKPSLIDSLKYLVSNSKEARAREEVQLALKNRIMGFPERALRSMHKVRVRVPVSVAQVLKHEPCLVSLAVEGFYDRDIDSMKCAARMEKFLSGGSGKEIVQVSVRMSRAMYAQLVQQMFQAPKCYSMLARTDGSGYVEAELGMKIACGFEMMYQQRRCEGSDVNGSSWDVFRKSLESSGYFKELLLGSKEYRRLMENAMEYYRNSSSFSRTSEMINAPVRRIDEILALTHSADDFKGADLPPSDDDAWLYDGEDELNSALLERQKEMEIYELNHKRSHKTTQEDNNSQSSSTGLNDFDPVEIAKTMQAFVNKFSSYEGAEVPENRDSKAVSLDVEHFFKDIESVMKQVGGEGTLDDTGIDEGSSSDMDFDGSEDGSDPIDGDDRSDTFMDSYSDALNEQLKTTTLEKSFIHANEQTSREKDEGASNIRQNMEESFTPVDVDVNLVKSLLDSFSSQQGLPGPASNLLGLMGLQLPKDAGKDK